MTTLPSIDAGAALRMYRALQPAPPDVRLAEIGGVCPVDDTVLVAELRGWCCPTCLAWWDLRGRAGMWLAGAPGPQPCPDHDDVAGPVIDGQLVDERDDREALRRLDRRCAFTVAAAAVCGVGYAAGQLAHPWAPLVPDTLVWTFTGGLVAAAVATGGVAVLWRWWAARSGQIGEVSDGR